MDNIESVPYCEHVLDLIRSPEFTKWIEALRDEQARSRIAARLARLASGNFGDVKPVGAGISELRIPYGPGYRIYVMQHGEAVVVLLCGGDKSTQAKDIITAKAVAERVRG